MLTPMVTGFQMSTIGLPSRRKQTTMPILLRRKRGTTRIELLVRKERSKAKGMTKDEAMVWSGGKPRPRLECACRILDGLHSRPGIKRGAAHLRGRRQHQRLL